MKISCEIIKDLLPLYYDRVCSNESRGLVDGHLNECDNCKSELQSMSEAILINNIDRNMNEAEAIKKLSKRWRKGTMKSILKSVMITILTIAVILFILYLFIDIRIVQPF